MKARKLLFVAGTIAIAAAVILPGPALAQEVSGLWESRSWEDDRDTERAPRVHLNLKLDRGRDQGNWQTGFGVDISELSGVPLSQVRGTATDVSFRLAREAGSLVFDGEFRSGRGTGFFAFTADAAYVRRMADLGYPGLSTERLFLFATQNVTTAYVAALADLGYGDLPEADLVKFAIHGVSADFVRGMNGLGYADIAPEQLVKLRIHGVSLEYVRRVRSALGAG